MENFLRKYGWALRLAGVAAVFLLIALAINGYAASVLAPYTVPSTPNLFEQAKSDARASNASSGTAKSDQNWTRAISERCFFGCVEEVATALTCPEEGCPEGQQCVAGQCVDAQPQTQELVDGALPVASDLNVKLMGVMVSNKPQWSTALLEDQGTKQTYVVRTDEEVMAQAKLVEVRRDRIIIERNGRLEYIRLVDAITGNPMASLSSAGRPPTGGAITPPPLTAEPIGLEPVQEPSAPPTQAVQRTDNNAYVIDRNSMNAQLDNKAALAQGATVVPNYKDGQKSGLKLMNVAPNSVYQQLGMQSGDVLQSVNGEKIRSQAHAMELMERFKQADSVAIEVERSGKREKLKYDIK